MRRKAHDVNYGMARSTTFLKRLLRGPSTSDLVATPSPPAATPPAAAPSPREVTLRWHTIPASETPNHPGLIHDLIAKRIDGMVIEGVYTPDEVERVLDRMGATEDRGWTPEPFGSMLGMPLNQLGDWATDRIPFLDDSERWRPIYEELFGFDPSQRIVEVLQPMAEGLAIGPPTEDGREYNPGNLRIYEPGRGGLRAHAGNEFIPVAAPGAMNHLLTQTQVRDHMSFFAVLQRPEIGGALSVYDLLYVDHPEHVRRWDGEDRDDAFFDEYPCIKVDPDPGDMVIFGGGWRWHRVDPVDGTIPRVTYGGFASPALVGSAINIWC